MLEPRKKKKRPASKWAVVIPIVLVLIASVLVFNDRALSTLTNVDKIIVFQGQEWNMAESFNKEWQTSSKPVTFTVDLSADFDKAKLQGQNVERPFDITAVNDGKSVGNIEYVKIGGTDFAGKYQVSIPFAADGKLNITVAFKEDDQWKLKAGTKTFSITRDATPPDVKLTGVENGVLTNKDVKINVEVIEENFDSNKVDVTVSRNGSPYKVGDWGTAKNKSYAFSEDGEYIFTVKAADKAGNESAQQQLNFAIRKKAPELTVSTGGKQLMNGEVSKTDSIDLEISSKIKIVSATVTVFKDGENIETQTFPAKDWEASLNYLTPGDAEYKFQVKVREKHAMGVEHTLPSFTFTADKTAPKLAILDVEEGGFYENDKEVNATVDEPNFGSAKFTIEKTDIDGKVTTDSVEVKGGQAKYQTTGEGKYTVTLAATDAAGNKAQQESVTFKIDKQGPILSISEDVDGKHFKTDKELTFSVKDISIVNAELTVTKDKDLYPIGDFVHNLFSASVTHNFTREGTYTVDLNSTDGKNRKSSHPPVTFTIDKNDPILTATAVEKEGKDKKKFYELTVDVTDRYIDWKNTSMKVYRNGTLLSAITGKDVVATHIFDEDGEYSFEITATDKAGRVTTKNDVKFTIDNTKPQLFIKGVEEGGHYQELENLELVIEDLTFVLGKTKLEVLKDGKPFDIGNDEWEILTKGGLKKAIKKLSFKDEGDYEIKLATTDLFGHVSELGPINFTIDGTRPVIDLVTDITEGDFIQKGKSVKVKVTEHNFEHNKVTIKATKDGKPYDLGGWDKTGEISELNHTFNKDGDYHIIVEAEDRAKNKATAKKLSFTVDNIKPKIDITGVKNGAYYKNDKQLKIEVEEHNYANNKVEIEVTRKVDVDGKKESFPIGAWKNDKELSELSYHFDRDGEYEITVKATDAAGNMGDTKTLVFTLDYIDPDLSITGVDDNDHYRSDRPVSVRVSDRNMDLSKTNLKVERNGKPYSIGALARISQTAAARDFTFSQEGSYVIDLNTTDKAGNSKKHDRIAFIIDKTNPVVKIEGVENNSFNPTGRNVTISIDELNYQTNNVSISATKDGAPFNIGTWSNSGKLSKLGYNFTRDGLYTILATAEDKAGNGPITKKMTFTVDKVKPAIQITGVENNAYYNVDKPVNVTIKDVNLDINKISVTRNGRAYGVGGFNVKGDTASLSHNFSGEGEYTILVEATDKADNSYSQTMKFTIDKTKPVITPKFKGQNRVIKNGEYINEVFTPEFALDEAEDMIVSATLNNGPNLKNKIPVAVREMAYNYKVLARDKAGNESTLEISFTIDTTKPLLSITGVLDGYFNKNIAPTVTYSDVHLDKGKTSVTLNGKPFANGTKLQYEQDYILKAVVTDLAKNVTSRTIVFTIDKTKPIIKFKEPISDKYFNTDLLPELLIEDMSAYDIIAMMLDGKPYEAGELITEEGKHVMFFEVKDKAGNIQQLSVEFIIDKTAPKVVYEGIKKGGKYHDPVDIAIRLDNPNDVLKSVTINGKDFNGEVVEENGYKVIKTTLAEIKKYEIKVKAYDEAGNETTTTIPFEIVEKGALIKLYENKPLLGGTIAGIIGLIGAATTMALRRRKHGDGSPAPQEE
ncbi:Ig-like domain-containing protein [Bacillus sp. REN3]|uniref:Ig-like domain-containing protein n=1 Tax=Bacillus sp. REN3 TaxID=2802440 RepID=UPI001AED8E14|nr:Ig-like domain-containing protein [Bacillus sp. REN3]